MMMSDNHSTPAAELAALDHHGDGLRIRFYSQGDRYFHQIVAIDGPLTRMLLESVEGDEQSIWPPSPPAQHVSVSHVVSDTQQGDVAMLVGASAQGHWSMCVSGHIRRKGEKNVRSESELQFDVACRTTSTPDFLACTYRVLAGSVALPNSMNCAFVPASGPGIVVIPKDSDVQVDGKRLPYPLLCCKATGIRINKLPTTIRWHYTIRRSSGGPIRLTTKSFR
jgi:hypothetical protein